MRSNPNNNNTKGIMNVHRQLTNLKRSMAGHENKLRRVDPGPVNRRPYYPLVVGQTFVSSGAAISLSVVEIIKALTTQLQLSAQDTSIITIKLQRIDCFAISKADSSVRPSLSVDFSSLIPTLNDPTTPSVAGVSYPHIMRLNDVGSVGKAASASYTWPQNMRAMPLSNQSNFNIIDFSTNLTEMDCRIHLLWSTADVATPV
jgi:hypothetical protein